MDCVTLAFIGDAVHTLFVRENFAKGQKIGELHKICSKFCKASTQSKALDEMKGILTDDESDIVRRARNTKTHDAPKNASLEDYKKATSFEALVGYLYVNNKQERLKEILNISICLDIK